MPTPRSNATRTHVPDRSVDYRILEILETHGSREGEALAAYKRVAETETNEGVRYLVKMILDDEKRHHQVFDEMANKVKSYVWEVDVEPKSPDLPKVSNEALLAETRHLLKFERNDAKELKELRKALKGSHGSSLHPLLVEVMLKDTEKHIAILKHIEKRLGG